MIDASVIADWEFCLGDPEEFTVRGRVSLTCVLRTVASLNPDCSRDDFIATIVQHTGLAANTAAKQYGISRAIDATMQ